ncbi:hypothetical protein BDK63_000393 [Halomonas campaniensis]|uniref:Tandem-95 repeat protein n=1 Tax=Halomonas campaniensis TaxID=213554 RepID=A0A7W5K0C1_9GAMM|nr:Ig-like domain-containing protein [Halomonas campaniensis]MBB3329553.1 hypothetical protein [Halomonas campaniensis]
MSTSPESDDLDTDLLETRFESNRSLPRERAVESEERRGLAQAPPDLDDADEPETDAITPPADVDDATPAEEADNLAGDEVNNEQSPAGSTDSLANEPATATSTTPTEDAPAGDEGHQPDEAPQADPDDTSGAPAEANNDPEVTATALPEEETAADATPEPEPEPKAEETTATTEHTQDQALLDDDDLVSFQSLEEDAEDSPTFLAMTTSTADEPEPITATSQFQQGQDGYSGVVDTFLYEGQSRANRSSQKTLTVDSEERRGEMQTLIRFENIFGDAAGQIPLGATILSATLELQTTTSGDGATLHRMLRPWSDGDTWDSLQSGIQADGVEALAQADLETGFVTTGTTRLDVTTSLQAWADGENNLGWAFLPLGPDGWSFDSAEGMSPPRLIVEYRYTPVAPVNNPPVAQDDTASTLEGSAIQIAVLENDSDPDGDPLTVGAVTQPSHGSVTLNPDGTLTYTPDAGFVGSDSFTYQASDGALLSDPATVQVTIEQAEPVNAPPLAQDDTASTVQGSAVQIAVLENDSDPDGDPLTVGAVTLPGNGSVTVNADGTLTYTPDFGFIGSDSFTYRAYDGQLLSDPATVQVTVSQGDGPPPLPLETSYIATAFGTNDRRNFEHTNATKSFFHDGEWWAVLPEQTGWHVYRFDGSLPDPGTLGGWVKSSPTMLTSGRRADIAWDDATDTLYVLNFGPSETSPRLFQLGYSAQTGTFEIQNNIQLAGSGGKLTGAEWQRNTEMSLGLDQNGSPVVAMIGPSAAGGTSGLKLAYPTSSSLATWGTTTVDPGPSTTAGSNGDNKVDFVAFELDGVAHVGLVYGDDATGLWKFAYQPTPPSPAGYGSGWTIDTITDAVVLDNHLAALWDGSAILMTMKDDQDALWAIRGMPGEWEEPVLVHAATHSASRPTLAYDEDSQTLFVFYQENTNRPYGDIYFKASSANELSFDPSDPGTLFVASTRDGEYMSDPQMPTHAVGEATDGMFFVFARNTEAKEIWYNDFQLADDWLIA